MRFKARRVAYMYPAIGHPTSSNDRPSQHSISGHVSACQQNAIQMAFCWQAENDPLGMSWGNQWTDAFQIQITASYSQVQVSDTGRHIPLIIRGFDDDYVSQCNVLGHLDSVGVSLISQWQT